MIEVLDDDMEGCANCDYGKGSTGLGSEGEPCEDCSHIRELRAKLAAFSRPDAQELPAASPLP